MSRSKKDAPQSAPPIVHEPTPLDVWDVATSAIGEAGRELHKSATPDQRQQLAVLLDLIAVSHLEAQVQIKPAGRNRFHLSGRVQANVVQTCVVTLEPLPGTMNDTFSVELWPSDSLPKDEPGEMVIANVLDIEGYDHEQLPVGRIIYETFAAGLDPHPRKPDAEFRWQDAKTVGAPETGKPNPFAVLKTLKLGPGNS